MNFVDIVINWGFWPAVGFFVWGIGSILLTRNKNDCYMDWDYFGWLESTWKTRNLVASKIAFKISIVYWVFFIIMVVWYFFDTPIWRIW